MTGQCIFSCVHPLYGGSGTCLGDGTCLCDDHRFSSTDAFGNPSCVLRSALLTVFFTAIVYELSLTAVLAFNIRQHWQLPRSARRGRRAAIWQRLTLVSCYTTACGVCIFSAALAATRGSGSLLEPGILQAYFTLTVPAGLFAGVTLMELWVDNLPTQLLATDSWAIKMKSFAEEKGLFFWVGVAATAFGGVLGLAMFFSSRPRRLISTINCFCSLSALLGDCGIVFVSVHVSRVIDRAAGRVQPAGREFYWKAKKTLWSQVGALCGLGLVFIGAAGTLELLDVGRGTPSIPWSITVVVTPTGYTIAAHLSRHRASPDSPRRVKVTALPGQAGSQVKSGAAGGVSSPQTPPRDIEAARDSPTIVVGTARVIPTME